MRHSLLTLLLLAGVAIPAQAQTCKKVPPPFLPSLLPEQVAGMPLEFATDPGGGCMALYRPESSGARATAPWAASAGSSVSVATWPLKVMPRPAAPWMPCWP